MLYASPGREQTHGEEIANWSGHLVWHLFVMAGTACHYFAVLWYAS